MTLKSKEKGVSRREDCSSRIRGGRKVKELKIGNFSLPVATQRSLVILSSERYCRQ